VLAGFDVQVLETTLESLFARAVSCLHMKDKTEVLTSSNIKDFFREAVLSLKLLRKTQWCNMLKLQTTQIGQQGRGGSCSRIQQYETLFLGGCTEPKLAAQNPAV